MLKMFHAETHSGSSPDFWEENWESSHFEEAVRFSTVDPLRPLFEKYLSKGSLMLEGGCGMGNYVSYYSARGFDVIGLDFAKQALKTLSVRQPGLPLVCGNVSELPFEDESFDLYYSGGVVEHFEGGAEKALDEARRVLKTDGVLLISVPYYNPLRRILRPFRRNDWRQVTEAGISGDDIVGKEFFQYAYTRREFSAMLSRAGLMVEETQGYAVLWGLYELPLLRKNATVCPNGAVRSNSPQELPAEIEVESLVQDHPSSLVKRLVVSEDASVPVLGLGVTFLRWAVANMMMYVCRRAE